MLTNQETDIKDNRDLVWNNDFGHCITEAAGRILKKSLELEETYCKVFLCFVDSKGAFHNTRRLQFETVLHLHRN